MYREEFIGLFNIREEGFGIVRERGRGRIQNMAHKFIKNLEVREAKA